MQIKVYVRESPIGLRHTVSQMFTEGDLLRLIDADGQSVWYPLVNLHKIEEIKEA